MLPCLVSVLHFKYRCAKIWGGGEKKSVAKRLNGHFALVGFVMPVTSRTVHLEGTSNSITW